MLGVLIFAWFLTCFNLDKILVSGINEVFGTDYSTNVYWLIVVIIAIIIKIVEYVNERKNK